VLIRSEPIPERYLSIGEYDLEASFYISGELITEYTGTFTSSIQGNATLFQLYLIGGGALFVLILFFGIDMAVNKRGPKTEFKRFFKR